MIRRLFVPVLMAAAMLSMAAYAQSPKAAKANHSEAETTKKKQEFKAIRLQGLEKITARRNRFDAMIGTVTRFGNLEIIPHACWQAPETAARPETAGLLEVWHWKPGDKPALLFFGWMFASSPALTSLQSAQYDLTVLECLTEVSEEASPDAEKSE